MRLAHVLLVVAGLAGASARGDDAPTLVLEVGETWSRPGAGGRCDDLGIADITVNGVTITARKPGRTVCGWSVGNAGGARTWVNVVVVEKGQRTEQGEQRKK